MLGVSQRTVALWKRTHPEFSTAMKTGKAEADARVTASLYERACGYSHKAVKIFKDGGGADGKEPLVVEYTERYAPDTNAAIFWLTNRRPEDWQNRQDLTVEGQVRHGHIHVTMADLEDREAVEEWRRLAKSG